MSRSTEATILAVCRAPDHAFHKTPAGSIDLVAGIGVSGDAHAGTTVRHRSRVAADPTQPNLRQVHLLQSELFDEAASEGFRIAPGQMGENITTAGIDLLSLPQGTILRLGAEAEVELTGLRNPCRQIDDWQPGLMRVVLKRDAVEGLVRRAGVMAVVRSGGTVAPDDPITCLLPPVPHRRLEKV